MNSNHWDQHALNWDNFSSPLRPHQEDIDWLNNKIQKQTGRLRNGLLLGVTPELVQLNWPSAFYLTAVDACQGMIQNVGMSVQKNNIFSAVNANWLSLPFGDQTFDVILGDGILIFFDYVKSIFNLQQNISRCLRLDGIFYLRVFVRSSDFDSIDNLVSDVYQNKLENFHVLKWRLAMILHKNLDNGVKTHDVFKKCWEVFGSEKALNEITGWSLNSIRTINAYQNSKAIYYFPNYNELLQMMNVNFDVIDVYWPTYQLGMCCPSFQLRLKS